MYYKSAQALFLPVKSIKELHGFELVLHKRHYFFCGAETPLNIASSARVASHKFTANRFLENAGIPVPKAVLLGDDELAHDAYRKKINALKFPLVIKPLHGTHGQGVLCNIQTMQELHEALVQAFSNYEFIIVEEFHARLLSYRVLVFNQRIIGVLLREPSAVIGDGVHTVAELIDLSNKERRRINEFLGPISLDEEALICLQEQGLTADYLPKIGEKVALGYTSNASRGGTYGTVSHKICKENQKILIKAANTLGLTLTGFDVQCPDINLPFSASEGVIIEANPMPSVRIHELPMFGAPNLVTKKIMRYFIFKHPFAYLASLYFNKRTGFYIRSALVTMFVVIFYLLMAGKRMI